MAPTASTRRDLVSDTGASRSTVLLATPSPLHCRGTTSIWVTSIARCARSSWGRTAARLRWRVATRVQLALWLGVSTNSPWARPMRPCHVGHYAQRASRAPASPRSRRRARRNPALRKVGSRRRRSRRRHGSVAPGRDTDLTRAIEICDEALATRGNSSAEGWNRLLSRRQQLDGRACHLATYASKSVDAQGNAVVVRAHTPTQPWRTRTPRFARP